MIDAQKMEEIIREVMDKLPVSLRSAPEELRSCLHSALQGVFSRLDLVTREEFTVQTKVLERTRQKLTALEAKLTAYEAHRFTPPEKQV